MSEDIKLVFILRNRFKNQSCKAYPGVDVDGDHNLIIIKCGLKFKKINESSKKYYEQNLKKT